MQNRQGYCSYCRVCYSNLEQHMSSDRHRYLTIQSRQWKGSRTLMERFLQDVLRHHPYRYQKSRSMQKKRLPMNTAAPSEVVPNNDFTPEEMAVDADGVRGEMPTKDSKPVEDMYSRSSKSQEYIQGVSVRPSVIQKVEKGQQQSLEFVHKIGNNMKEFNSVGAHFDSVGECDPNKVDKYLKQEDVKSQGKTLSAGFEAHEFVGIFEDGIPKHHEEFFPNMDCTQEGKHLAFLEQKTSVSSEMKLAGGSLQSASDHPEEDVPDLWKEEQIDQEDKNYELRSSEMSFDGKEVHADLQYKNSESSVSEISSDCDGSLHLITNQTQSSDDYPQQPDKEANLLKRVHSGLVDMNYGSKRKLQKKVHIGLLDMNYGSSSSEIMVDQLPVAVTERKLQKKSVVDHPQLAVRERNLVDRLVYLKDKNRKPSSAKAHLDCDVFLETVTDEPQRAIEEINLKEKNDLMDMSYESYGSEMSFHTDAQLAPDQSQVAVKEVNIQEVAVDLESNDQPQGALSEINLKELNIDMEYSELDVEEPELADKETVIQKEGYVHLGGKDDEPTTSKIKEWVPVENRENKPNGSELSFDYGSSKSDTSFQLVANHPDVAIKEINLQKEEHANLAENEPQIAVKEINVQKEECVGLENKSNKYSSSDTISDSDVPPRSLTEKPQVTVLKEDHVDPEVETLLKEKHVDLGDKNSESGGGHVYSEDKNSRSSGSEMRLDSEFMSVPDQLRETVKEKSLCKDQSVAGQTREVVKEINLWKEHVDLEDKVVKPSDSKINFDSDAPLQSVTNKIQEAVTEINLREGQSMVEQPHVLEEQQANLEDKSSDPSGHSPEAVKEISLQEKNDSGVHLCLEVGQSQVVLINEPQESVNLVTGDNDCEVISDSDVPFQPVIDSPQMTVEEISCINAESFVLEINQKKDYIILEESSWPEKKKAKYIDPKDKSCQSNSLKRKFEWEDTCQPLAHQLQKVDKGVSLWKDVENTGLKDKNYESNVSAKGCNESPELVIHQVADKENLLKLKCADLERNLEKAKEVTEDDPDEQVPEGVPQTPASLVVSDCDDGAGGISDIDDFPVALDKPSHFLSTKRHWMKRRMTGQEKDSPGRKRLLLQNDRKTRKNLVLKSSQELQQALLPSNLCRILLALQEVRITVLKEALEEIKESLLDL
ncbi:DBF4-type zinc finger-containing protein 2 [Camelus ferus]|nr:DBF4-type zinc finger-containing protein 2 [Camelus ferus]